MSPKIYYTFVRFAADRKQIIDVISGMVVDNVGMDVPIKFGDCRSNGFRDIRGAHFVSNGRPT